MAKPRHIGIILDGNRRFAKRLMLEPWKGHDYGAEKVRKLVGWAKKLGVNELTLYAFSIQNFGRPKDEFDYLMGHFLKAFNDIVINEDIHKNKVRVKAIGRLNLLPENVQEAIRKAEETTKDYSSFFLNIAIAYGGREEVVDAMKKIGRAIEEGKLKPENITEDMFRKNLYMGDEPDLIIRTGGERRTSNFLIWQSNYSEWVFLEKTWPEFEESDFVKCIDDFEKRERRFGR